MMYGTSDFEGHFHRFLTTQIKAWVCYKWSVHRSHSSTRKLHGSEIHHPPSPWHPCAVILWIKLNLIQSFWPDDLGVDLSLFQKNIVECVDIVEYMDISKEHHWIRWNYYFMFIYKPVLISFLTCPVLPSPTPERFRSLASYGTIPLDISSVLWLLLRRNKLWLLTNVHVWAWRDLPSF